MAQEIERKFLVVNDSYRTMATDARHLTQGYLSTDPDRTVRVRIADDLAWLTIKSRNEGCVRGEWEYAIPAADARELMELCTGTPIVKTRFIVPYQGYVWEVDEFAGAHNGMVVAEVELADADANPQLPPFVGDEVTGNPAYYNSRLQNKF